MNDMGTIGAASTAQTVWSVSDDLGTQLDRLEKTIADISEKMDGVISPDERPGQGETEQPPKSIIPESRLTATIKGHAERVQKMVNRLERLIYQCEL